MTLHGVFDAFECFLHEFGSIESNSKKHRNIEKIRFGSIELIRTNSVEFDSVRYYCIRYQKKKLDINACTHGVIIHEYKEGG